MGQKPGHKKGGGRTAGSKNKKTVELLELWDTLKYDPARALHELLPRLDDEIKATVHLKLMAYKYPQRKAVEVSGPDEGAIDVNNSEMSAAVQILTETVLGYKNERDQK